MAMTKVQSQRRGLVYRSFGERAFTLIEMLTVIVIVALLMALLFPAAKKALQKAEITQARGDIRNIEHAIKAFQNEYGMLPTKDQGSADIWYDLATAYNIYNILRGTSTTWNGTDYNPRKIVFLETPSRKNCFDSNGNFLDPWGQVYYLKLDCDYDNTISHWGVRTNLSVVIVSFGPNGTQEDPALSKSDDIVNFQ